MYDPENKKNGVRASFPKTSVRHPREEDYLPKSSPKLLSERERLRYYLMNDPGTRLFYGFEIEKVNGKKYLKIADLKKLERMDGETKVLLRDLYQELKKPEFY